MVNVPSQLMSYLSRVLNLCFVNDLETSHMIEDVITWFTEPISRILISVNFFQQSLHTKTASIKKVSKKKLRTDLAHEYYVGYGWTACFLREMLTGSDTPVVLPLLQLEDYTALWASVRYCEKLNNQINSSVFAIDTKDDWLSLDNVPARFGSNQ